MNNSNWWITDPEVLFNPAVAQVYDLFAWPFVSATTAKILKELNGSGEILEIGCGTGLATVQLAKAGKVTAVEPSRYMLKKASEKVKKLNLADRVHLLSDRAEALPVDSDKFDAVVLSYVMRHIKPEKLDLATREITRVTRHGGKIMIADLHLPLTGAFPMGINRGNPSYTILGVLSLYDPPALAHYMENYGLRFSSVNYYPLSFLLVLDKP